MRHVTCRCVQEEAKPEMRPAAYLLCAYIGYAAGSLQVLAFKDRLEVLGILILVTIVALIVLGTKTSMRMQQPVKKSKAIPKRASVARRSKAVKSRMRVVKS